MIYNSEKRIFNYYFIKSEYTDSEAKEIPVVIDIIAYNIVRRLKSNDIKNAIYGRGRGLEMAPTAVRRLAGSLLRFARSWNAEGGRRDDGRRII